MDPSFTSVIGFSGSTMSAFSISTSLIRFADAVEMAIIRNTTESIIRLINIFMQYASILINSPVVNSSDTINCAPR